MRQPPQPTAHNRQPIAYSQQPAGRRAAGFTLIELLVVIIIIAILSSMVLGGISVLREAITKARNDHLVGQIRLGISQPGVEPAPVVHPLAATAAFNAGEDHFGNGTAIERARFYRDGSLLAVTGEGLTVGDLAWLDGSGEQALMPDDRYGGYRSDGDNPSLFGLPRRQLRVLGVTATWIDCFRELPGDESSHYNEASSTLTAPYDGSVYPDGQFLRKSDVPEGSLLEELSRRTVERSLGAVLSELSQQGALVQSGTPDDTVMLTRIDTVSTQLGAGSTTYSSSVTVEVDAAAPETGSYDQWHRIWYPPDGALLDQWEPGHIYDEDLAAWRPYRQRGTSLVDHYGCDILVWRDIAGNLQVTSAGPDGCFVIHPGPNGVLDTSPADFDGTRASLGGDDAWAATDNQGTRGGEE